jgi:hypothetical protein
LCCNLLSRLFGNPVDRIRHRDNLLGRVID